MPASAMIFRPASTAVCTAEMSPVMVTNALPPSAIATRTSNSWTGALLAQASAARISVATLKDSRMPSAPSGGATDVRARAVITSGWILVITKLSIRQPVAASQPAAIALCTADGSPAISTMYLPEQIERDSTSRTVPAFRAASATRNPATTLESSTKPMDFSVMEFFSASEHDVTGRNLRNCRGKRGVDGRAQGFLRNLADHLALAHPLAGLD